MDIHENRSSPIPSSWAWVDFNQAFTQVSVRHKIPSSSYLSDGPLPVIDQGQQFVGGYTDKIDAAIDVGDGLIVFGDHTRVFKKIRFAFAAGADGIKVLKPFLAGLDYSYFACLALQFPDKGYARHYSHLRSCKVPLAPEAEQARIVSKIDELFSSIDEGERALERVSKLVERYRQSVLKAAVTGELTREWREQHAGELESGEALLTRILEARRQAWEQAELAKMVSKNVRLNDQTWKHKYVEPASIDASQLPCLPIGWAWVRAEQVCDFITKGTTPKSSSMTSGEGDIPYVKVYNLTFNGELDFTKDPTYVSHETHRGDLNRSRVYPGDVLMNIVGPPLGKVSIVPATYPEWNMNQAVAVFRPLEGVNREFLAFYLLSRAAQDWYKTKAKATAGQFNLTLEICRDTPIPLPPLPEQIRIRDVLKSEQSRDENLSLTLKREASRSSALKQVVLRSAFSGQLVPQDPTDEPASVLLERIAAERAAAPKRTIGKPTRAKKAAKSKVKA